MNDDKRYVHLQIKGQAAEVVSRIMGATDWPLVKAVSWVFHHAEVYMNRGSEPLWPNSADSRNIAISYNNGVKPKFRLNVNQFVKLDLMDFDHEIYGRIGEVFYGTVVSWKGANMFLVKFTDVSLAKIQKFYPSLENEGAYFFPYDLLTAV